MPAQPPTQALPTAIAEALARKATVLTSTQRAARALHSAYASQRREQGHTAWPPPAIFPWNEWTDRLWQQLVLSGAERRLKLSALQEELVWTQIFATEAARTTLRAANSLAPLAREAWALLARYNGLSLDGSLSGSQHYFKQFGSSDAKAFSRWAQNFEALCRKEEYLPAAQIELALRAHIEQGSLRLDTEEIVLLGFDALSPVQARLCESLRESGTAVTMLPLAAPASKITIATASDPAEEMRSVGRSIRTILEKTPHARIAIVLPDVSSMRAELESILLTELAPELQTPGATAPRPFEFSLGPTLHLQPMVRVALDLLRWTMQPLPIAQVTSILLSPYLAGAESELHARAHFDAYRLRQLSLLQPELSLQFVLTQLARTSGLPLLQKQLSALQQHSGTAIAKNKKPAIDTYSAWMELAAQLLDAVAWAHPFEARSLNTTEYQQQQKFQQLLDNVATLNFANRRVDFATAFAALEHAAAETPFAPESHNAPVQVMGTLESAGSTFDFLYVLNVTDLTWPSPGRTHPLLPWQLQKDLRMPHADPIAEEEEARFFTQRMASSAPTVHFSYARNGAEGSQCPAAALRTLATAQHIQLATALMEESALITLEDSIDDTFPSPLPENIAARGGATLLKRQAECPFRAFAEHRLASRPLDDADPGLDSMERGNLIHNILKHFWDGVRTQANLLAMTQEAVLERLREAILHALQNSIKPGTAWDRAYMAVQRDWLLALLTQWLDYERTRPPFEMLEAEVPRQGQIGPLHMNLRVDRIDSIQGGQVIIDYKTGKVGKSAWDGPRPDEPQLPLYAVLADQELLQGLAFSSIRTGEMKLSGITSAANMIAQTKVYKGTVTPLKSSEVDDVAYRVDEWRTVLTQLAHDFANGESAVDPKQYPQTCLHCAQKPLCRVQELNLFAAEDESEETAAGEEADA